MTAIMGLSAQAIAGSGRDHPWDPSDLLRCVRYCEGRFSTDDLRNRMTGRSVEWDRLLPEWDNLVASLRHEMNTRTDGTAPATYAAMRRVIAGGITCAACDGSGGRSCEKCKGTGKRSGGRCRASGCAYGTVLDCAECRGRGYTVERAS